MRPGKKGCEVPLSFGRSSSLLLFCSADNDLIDILTEDFDKEWITGNAKVCPMVDTLTQQVF